MYIKDVKEIISKLESSIVEINGIQPLTGKLGLNKIINVSVSTLKHTIESNPGDVISLTDDELDFLEKSMPYNCSHYVHCNGNFFFIDFQKKVATHCTKDVCDGLMIFDLNRVDFDNLGVSLMSALNIIEASLRQYSNSCIYNPVNYTMVKTVETPSTKFDGTCSLTKEEADKVHLLQKSHNKKFHKKGFGYQGVSPVSNFEIRFGSCSLGSWCDCVCTVCEKGYNKLLSEDSLDSKKLEKLKKQAFMEVRGLD